MDDKISLFRYMSFPEFVSICINNELRFVHPTSWEDTFEGSLLLLLGTPQGDRDVVSKLYSNYFNKDVEKTLNGYMRLWSAKYGIYGRCWTTLDESDAMWRIYSYNKQSVQIETTATKLQSVIDENGTKYVYSSCIKSVAYDLNQNNVVDDSIRFLNDDKELFTPYLHKRKAYKHEEEYRGLLYLNPLGNRTGMLILSAADKIKKMNLSDEDNINEICKEIVTWRPDLNDGRIPDEINIKVENLMDYVVGVTVNPFAQGWFCDLVGSVCSQYGLKLKGKSRLYEKV